MRSFNHQGATVCCSHVTHLDFYTNHNDQSAQVVDYSFINWSCGGEWELILEQWRWNVWYLLTQTFKVIDPCVIFYCGRIHSPLVTLTCTYFIVIYCVKMTKTWIQVLWGCTDKFWVLFWHVKATLLAQCVIICSKSCSVQPVFYWVYRVTASTISTRKTATDKCLSADNLF